MYVSMTLNFKSSKKLTLLISTFEMHYLYRYSILICKRLSPCMTQCYIPGAIKMIQTRHIDFWKINDNRLFLLCFIVGFQVAWIDEDCLNGSQNHRAGPKSTRTQSEHHATRLWHPLDQQFSKFYEFRFVIQCVKNVYHLYR